MSILNKKNFFERLSGSRLTREVPMMETANKTPSIVINDKVRKREKETMIDLSSMFFDVFLMLVMDLGKAGGHMDERDGPWEHLLREQLGFRHMSHTTDADDTRATLE